MNPGRPRRMCEERATNIYNDVVLEMESALIRVGVAVGAISFFIFVRLRRPGGQQVVSSAIQG